MRQNTENYNRRLVTSSKIFVDPWNFNFGYNVIMKKNLQKHVKQLCVPTIPGSMNSWISLPSNPFMIQTSKS